MLGIKPQISGLPALRYGGLEMWRRYMMYIDSQCELRKHERMRHIHFSAA
jgi:hypothetical protein